MSYFLYIKTGYSYSKMYKDMGTNLFILSMSSFPII